MPSRDRVIREKEGKTGESRKVGNRSRIPARMQTLAESEPTPSRCYAWLCSYVCVCVIHSCVFSIHSRTSARVPVYGSLSQSSAR